ncbi:hypothetical protein [Azonexus sp. IMCC34839]|uniref:hypothetical protein n=1 Tax=Azonexus sp. IMCC34839 TaxID=3133695 RepID=UPI00399BAAC8
MPNPIIARADALMQRRRQNGSEADDVPVLTDAVDDEDIPVLFNVDLPHFEATHPALDEPLPTLEISFAELPPEADEASAATAFSPEAPAPEFAAYPLAEPAEPAEPEPVPATVSPATDVALREALIREVAQRIERRLAAELPQLIADTVAEILAEQASTDEIR